MTSCIIPVNVHTPEKRNSSSSSRSSLLHSPKQRSPVQAMAGGYSRSDSPRLPIEARGMFRSSAIVESRDCMTSTRSFPSFVDREQGDDEDWRDDLSVEREVYYRRKISK